MFRRLILRRLPRGQEGDNSRLLSGLLSLGGFLVSGARLPALAYSTSSRPVLFVQNFHSQDYSFQPESAFLPSYATLREVCSEQVGERQLSFPGSNAWGQCQTCSQPISGATPSWLCGILLLHKMNEEVQTPRAAKCRGMWRHNGDTPPHRGPLRYRDFF